MSAEPQADRFVTKEDLMEVRLAKLILELNQARVEAASKNLEAVQLRVFVKHGLSLTDTFDLASGKITIAPAA